MTDQPAMRRRPQLTVVSSSNFARAYGGIAYLASALVARGVDVEAHGPIPPEMLPELRRLPFPVHSVWTRGGVGSQRSALVRFRLRCLVRGIRRAGAWLFTDLSFFSTAVAIKRVRPASRLIHYCPEFLTPEEFPHIRQTRVYARHADAPDLVIDVNLGRAERRRARFGLTREILILPNTLPLAELPPPAPPGALDRLAGGNLPADLPVLLYAGAPHAEAGFDRVITALRETRTPVFLLAFCGDGGERSEALRAAVQARLGPQRGRVCRAVARRDLLACMHQADAGLAYYPFSVAPSWNQLHCAPTKAYEYLAVGLPVVASNNPPLIELIAARSLGACTADDTVEALRATLDDLFQDRSALRRTGERAREAFAQELSFERVAPPVVDRVVALLDRAEPR
jgi:glycosyltransferase involved in cell wall biosynthesis